MPDYMVREAMTQSLLVTRQIHNPRQDSRMLLATQHSATGQVTQWIKKTICAKWHINGDLSGFTASGELIAANLPMRCE
ncbi:LysR family transcriptional regulator [Escherichia coli]|uniref:LysR family transcriptional regulator n=1 Tax=Escherichia coli TaxID=562 RepID=A0A2X1N2E8_ECOLX|nr:LysR family transcriptional regulator [Escherichia coli]SPX11793.1 LysR family transcriptional regulator [Escherichia coli]